MISFSQGYSAMILPNIEHNSLLAFCCHNCLASTYKLASAIPSIETICHVRASVLSQLFLGRHAQEQC